ncbi:hypothetical protein BDP55DRAFT_119083 [Colletotrichum godetiae]|uniref:Uncharacterized protein n=1 Tax=Colletotrichum godetiae TaxID=1209918 RepID=A0AAJ0EYB6_9PEZI|nr:uncharacterized protein BDP55DRAFT_119083 [Colletotrichum godetiae]KAK1676014.1 hypothetical protein BDP55DRAFT_119083 [Colletotrichum godetiae]
MTSSRAEREGLAEAIYKHVTFRPYFGVAIRSPGLRTFNLHFQIPTFVLRYRKGNSNGDSGTDEIRQSIDLSFLFPSTRRTHDASTPQSLDERHISLLVTGFDEARWTAYCFADSHLDGEESLRALADYTDRELLTDPVSCGKLPLGALWDPREYFLAILRIRLRQFDNEWARTVQFLDQAIANQLSQESDRRMRGSPFQDNKLESQIRLAHTEALITQLLHTISGTIESWERFQEDQLDSYFDGLQTRPSFPFDACRQDMLKAIGNVRNYEDSLHSMKSLCQVKYSPTPQYSVLQTTKHQTERRIRILTSTFMLFMPLSLSASIMSTNIMPLSRSWPVFLLTAVVFAVLMMVHVFIATIGVRVTAQSMSTTVSILFMNMERLFYAIIIFFKRFAGKFRQFKAGQPKIDQDLEIEAGSPHPSRLLERLASRKSESLGAGIMHLIRSKFHRQERDAAMDLNLPHRGEARSHGPHDIELNNIKCPPVP